MSARPFAYNPNTGTTMSGVTNYGNLAIATGAVNWSETGLDWYMGPDEDLGYIIGGTYQNIRPTFWRTSGMDENSFLNVVSRMSKQKFTSTPDAYYWLFLNKYYTNFIHITAGTTMAHFVPAIKNGQIWSWGQNNFGQLGINSIVCKSTPVSILGNKKTFCKIHGGAYHINAIDKNGQMWGWGYNPYAQIGDNSQVCKSTPVSVLGAKKTFCNISNSQRHNIAIDKQGQIWSWGDNTSGRLGDNTVTLRMTPVSILGAKKTFCQIDVHQLHSGGIDKNGQIWEWGSNTLGQLGDNTVTSRLTPVSILGVKKTFCKISTGGKTTLSIDKNGQLWGWGYNNKGQLGINSTVCKSTPVSILGNKKTICQITSGFLHTLAIDNHGQIWGWGYNNKGQLGNNSIVDEYTPISILGVKKTFCQLYAGFYHSGAVDSNGQIWGWGWNDYGQLDNNSVLSAITPIKIIV